MGMGTERGQMGIRMGDRQGQRWGQLGDRNGGQMSNRDGSSRG